MSSVTASISSGLNVPIDIGELKQRTGPLTRPATLTTM